MTPSDQIPEGGVYWPTPKEIQGVKWQPVRWTKLISWLIYFLTFSGIAGVLFTLAEMGGR